MDKQNFIINSQGDLLKAKVRQTITRLFKSQLILLEELTDNHDEAMNKLYEALPQEYQKLLMLADYLSDDKIDSNRRKVLKEGNDSIRELENFIDSLNIK